MGEKSAAVVGRREDDNVETREGGQFLVAVAVAPGMSGQGRRSAKHMYYIKLTCSSAVRMALESSTAVCSSPPARGALSMPSQEFMLQCR